MFSELNKVANSFTIKDLENLSGIQAHTIRIWEKRYTILNPERTETNIRHYDLQDLQKLLNVTALYNRGMKISKIAKLNNDELQNTVREEISVGRGEDQYVGSLILAMLNFDQAQFEFIYNRMTAETSFRRVFLDVFVPLLHKLGLDWQSHSITPAHEHFISHLIMQKLHINIERVQQAKSTTEKKVFALYLPENEIHEFGLLYIHYELALKGYHSIFLGQSVPMSSLKPIRQVYDEVYYISYFTVQPWKEDVVKYLEDFYSEFLADNNDQLWILGRNTTEITVPKSVQRISKFEGIEKLIDKL
ncbi:MAG: MerR family transcriptional regulator [Vicingaceae bacterium]